jgi:DNA polymerase III delta prime subunit
MPKQMSGKTFSNLLSYYIACLEQEDIMSVTFKISSEGTAFLSTLFQTELLFHANNKQVMAKNTEGVKKFFQTSLLQQKNKTLFYGYPVVIGPEGTLSPLFFIELQYEQKDDVVALTNLSAQKRLNHYILSKNNFSAEEIMNIQQEIEEEEFSNALASICKILNFCSTDCTSALDEKPFKRTITPKLINKAIIYYGEQTDITHNLIVELSQLKKKPVDDLASSSLLLLLAGEYQPDTTSQNDKPLLEIFSLNSVQEYAVLHSLRNSLTVITGPPGTGKSQVVLNIIANAVYQNKTVLFASKNNKAVDVVTDKFNTVLPYKLLVRMGHQAHRRNAKSELEHLIKQHIQKISPKEKNLNDLLNVASQIQSLRNQICSLTTLNESLENIQDILDSLHEMLPDDLPSLAHHLCLEKIDVFILEEDLKRFFGKPGILRKLKRERYKRKQGQCFRKYYETLPSALKTYLQNMISNKKTTMDLALQWILILKKEELAINELHKIKNTLLTIPPYIELKGQLAVVYDQYIAISRSLFQQHWVNKFAETDAKDRQHILTYFSTSERLESWKDDRNIFRQLSSHRIQTLQKILKFLPAWVVTNLSVKQSIPLKNNLFDILIIDEASQCDITSALPLFYRAKHAVIIGDPCQLKHISLLTENQDRSLATTYHIPKELFTDLSYTKHSLYDLGEQITQAHDEKPVLLNEHYRCHPDIVSFSNEYYYGRKLTIATDEKRLLQHPSFHTRILWHHVKGKTVHAKSPYNEEEAEKVVEEILRILELVSSLHASIGVVTLFRAQTEMITEKLNRFQDILQTDITIGTAHRFQGDEKDVIIFSPAVSEGVKAGTLHWIQTTNQLLNVAVTRARSLFIIVGDQDVCRQTIGPLKDLSDYVEMTKMNDRKIRSPTKQILYNELKKHGIPILTNYRIKGISPHLIDFALFVNGNRYAIEIQDIKKKIDKKQLIAERWKIRRFSEQDILHNLSYVVEEIKRLC